MKIFTSRYSNPAVATFEGARIGFTIGYPRFVKYPFTWRKDWAPERAWLQLPEAEYRPFYLQKLEMIGPEVIMRALTVASHSNLDVGGSGDIVLLCYEDLRRSGEWCHRQMFTQWVRERAGVEVEELPDPTQIKGGPKVEQVALFNDPNELPKQVCFC